MSTRRSIKWRDRTEAAPGYHLFDDCTDFGETPPVYLRLEGVDVDLEAPGEGGAAVELTIPQEMARELGLLPPAAPAAPTTEPPLGCRAGHHDQDGFEASPFYFCGETPAERIVSWNIWKSACDWHRSQGALNVASTAETDVAGHSEIPTDSEIRASWRKAGGRFHGPIVETATMPEADLFDFVRGLIAAEREAGVRTREAS